jgi:hypothetical protein
MSTNENDKLKEEFFDECATQWTCPYCGDPVREEYPVCCGENHGSPHTVAPCGTVLGPVGETLDEREVQSAFEDWLSKRGEA